MKNSTMSSLELDVQLRSITLKLLKKISKQNNPVHESCPYTTQPDNNYLPVGEKFLSKKYRDLIGYLILFHYYPVDEKHYCYLYMDLQDHINEIPESFWLSVLVENREYFLKWLEDQQTMTVGEFFGQICNVNSLENLMKTICIKFEETFRKPKRVIRRKGYKDKGSRQDESVRIIIEEESKDIFLTILQYEIETKREIRHKEILLFKEYLTEGRKLEDEFLVKFKILPKERTEHERKFTEETRA